MRNIFYVFIAFFAFLLASCNGGGQATTHQTAAADSLQLQYAKGFSIKYYTNFKKIIVYSPWVKGAVYARYYLVTDNKTKTPADGIKVQIPLKTLAATSVTHLEFLSLLDEINTITGVCSPKIIYNREINKRIEEGQLQIWEMHLISMWKGLCN